MTTAEQNWNFYVCCVIR